MYHDRDPRDEMLEKIGNLNEVEVMHNQILVMVYIRPDKTASGLYISDKTRDEDRFQGKAGLVLKKGPQAFVDDEINKFAGQNVEPGDWVFYRVSDGFPINIKGQLCRLLEEVHIKGKINSPDVVF
jgi:co-chaperonin GroES (HSP10)